jgi:hypothetical protein
MERGEAVAESKASGHLGVVVGLGVGVGLGATDGSAEFLE